MTRMPRRTAEAFRDAFLAIARDETAGLDIRPLRGRPGHGLRIGDYRAIYERRRETREVVVLVLKVGPRGDVYK